MTTPTALYTGPTAAELASIPEALKARPQWVVWRGVDKVDEKTGEIKLSKEPYNARPVTKHGRATFTRKASSTNKKTWGTFAAVVAALPPALAAWEHEAPADYRGGGLGFVFSPDDPCCGIDLDKCRNPETGALEPRATAIIAQVDSYSETSPTGTGVHILAQGALPPDGRKTAGVEMYTEGRFFTITGQHLAGTPTTIEARQDAITAVHAAHVARPAAPPSPPRTTPALDLDDMAILVKANAAQNGALFAELWAGDTSRYGGDDSRADEALCCALAFWTRDASQMDRLFRGSGLMRDKWDERRGKQTYGERTIGKALSTVQASYDPDAWLDAQIAAKKGRNGKTPDGDPTPETDVAADLRPRIYIGTDITKTVDETQQALGALPDAPLIYQRARALCLIGRSVQPPKWLHRPPDLPLILDAGTTHLWELAGKAACWLKFDKREEEWVSALPPRWAVEALQERRHWPFPLLEGVVCSPTLRPDGSLLMTPGYDPETGLYLDMGGTIFPAVPDRPTIDDATVALGVLLEPLHDFPFAEPHHKSAALAGILSMVCRYAIPGNIPLFAIRANTRGSGKGLLADVMSIIGTGRAAPRWPQVGDDDEERKRLLTVALAGYPVIHIDNVTKPLGSPALDLALTAPSFSDRILGKTDSREAPLSMVWLASGNNMQFKGDTARRIVPIGLDPKVERPEERTGFLHQPLLLWVHQQRPWLVTAALTLLRAYCEAGRPSSPLTPMGSFEAWSDLIRQALLWVGQADPNQGRTHLEAESDPEYERLAVLLDAWDACYPIPQGKPHGEPQPLRDVVADIERLKMQDKPRQQPERPNDPNEYDRLQDALGAFDPRYDGKSLRTQPIGTRLNTIQARTIGEKRLIIKGKNRANQSLWCLENPMITTSTA